MKNDNFYDIRYLATDLSILKPHCIRCSHFKVDDVGALEPSSKPPVRIVETSKHNCISNVRHDPGYGLNAVTMPWMQ
jgi:hypothetical protein